ncbi:hypothetical protein ABPG75_001050 [Micractinium tetrahymenae]
MTAAARGTSSSPAAAAAAGAAAPAAAAPAAAAAASNFEAAIPRLMHYIDFCNNGAAAAAAGEFLPLTVEGRAVGYLRPSFAHRLLEFPDVFQTSGSSSSSDDDAPAAVAVNPALATQQQRTAAIAGVLEQLRAEGLIEGWRNELYPAVQAFHDEPVFLIERAAAPHFGIKAYGVHINGYVTLPDGSKELWVAKRSSTKPTWPGKLDHIAAGGQPHGLSCMENVVKECEEEASIPPELAARARPVGAVSYTSLQPAGLKRDVLFCFDLELPEDFVPKPLDGEVECFMRVSMPRLCELLTSEEGLWKENCTLVIMHWLSRHGYLTPDQKGYLELLSRLQSGDCS